MMRGVGRLNNSWWLQHRQREASARIAYGDIYNLPTDLGTYDVAFFGSVLLHLRDPFRALQQSAEHTSSTMIVTDMLHHGLGSPDESLVRWGTDVHVLGPAQTWWQFSPGAITRMLWRLGFGRVSLTRHERSWHGKDFPMFTVVATREAHRPRLPRPTHVARLSAWRLRRR